MDKIETTASQGEGKNIMQPQTSERIDSLDVLRGFALLCILAMNIQYFSMLFGAGIVLFTERATANGRSAKSFHYRRNFWLRHFRFGLLEWLWRSLTYWQRQAFVRNGNLVNA